jgi:RNA polymerase primary sigma factor
MYWIRSAIKRQQIFQSRVISVPQRLYENHKRIMRVGSELQKTLGRPPTKQEIGAAVGMSELQVERCITAMAQRCYSLDQFMSNTKKPMSGDSQEDTMYEVVASRPDDGDYNSLQRLFLREDLIETLYRHLTEEEANLLLLRYGLVDESSQSLKTGGPLTIAEVSRLVGLKPDKVRRMLNSSLEQLKTIIGEEWAGCEYDRLQH